MNFTNEEVQDLRNNRPSQAIVTALFLDSVPEIDSHLEKINFVIDLRRQNQVPNMFMLL